MSKYTRMFNINNDQSGNTTHRAYIVIRFFI